VGHSKYDQEVGVSQFSQMTMGQYWLCKTKLLDWPEMLSKSCHRIKKKLKRKKCLMEFFTDSPTNCLPDIFQLA